MGVSKRRNYPQPLVSTLLVTSLNGLGQATSLSRFSKIEGNKHKWYGLSCWSPSLVFNSHLGDTVGRKADVWGKWSLFVLRCVSWLWRTTALNLNKWVRVYRLSDEEEGIPGSAKAWTKAHVSSKELQIQESCSLWWKGGSKLERREEKSTESKSCKELSED